jgi:hypothetical protein
MFGSIAELDAARLRPSGLVLCFKTKTPTGKRLDRK